MWIEWCIRWGRHAALLELKADPNFVDQNIPEYADDLYHTNTPTPKKLNNMLLQRPVQNIDMLLVINCTVLVRVKEIVHSFKAHITVCLHE